MADLSGPGYLDNQFGPKVPMYQPTWAEILSGVDIKFAATRSTSYFQIGTDPIYQVVTQVFERM